MAGTSSDDARRQGHSLLLLDLELPGESHSTDYIHITTLHSSLLAFCCFFFSVLKA